MLQIYLYIYKLVSTINIIFLNIGKTVSLRPSFTLGCMRNIYTDGIIPRTFSIHGQLALEKQRIHKIII